MTSDQPATPAYLKPLPDPSPASRPFWEGARQHKLRIQRSRQTGRYVFYPRNVSPFGARDELEWVDASGRGTVYAFTVARRATAPQWEADVPYVIAIVALEEGPHLTTNIVGCTPEAVRIGMPVVAVFDDVTPEVTLVKFAPDATNGDGSGEQPA